MDINDEKVLHFKDVHKICEEVLKLIEKQFEKACNFVRFEQILNNPEELEKRAWIVFQDIDDMNTGKISKKQLFIFM